MKIRYCIFTALYCAVIFKLSSESDPSPIEIPIPHFDKIMHFILFAGLCAIISVGLHRAPKPLPMPFRIYLPIVFSFCYAVTDEIHQLFVPRRSFDIEDLAADAAGAIVVQILLMLWWLRIGPKRRARRAERVV